LILGIPWGESLQNISQWLESLALQYGYLGIFIISFLGSVSVVFPIPYTLVIFYVGSTHMFDPLFIALSGGAGSAIGEFFGYLMGYYGRAILSEERKRKIDCIMRVFNRYGAAAIFVFALTPLPDDLLFIPLGMMRYSFLKTFIPCLAGKVLMCLILAYGGYLSIGMIESLLGEEGGYIGTIASFILLIIILVLMLKVDWEKFLPLEEDRNDEKPHC